MSHWTPEQIDDAVRSARAAATGCGLDSRDARILRVRSAVLVVLPQSAALARVEPVGAVESARRQVQVSLAAEEVGAPMMRLMCPSGQPFELPGGVVTIWEWLEGPARPPTGREHGQLLRALHTTRRPSLPVPAFNPFPVTLRGLAGPHPDQDPAVLATAHQRAQMLQVRWPALVASDPLGQTLVHGDAHLDNVVLTDDGPVLVDLESAGWGPSSWDLAVLAVAVRRYGAPHQRWLELVEGYRVDPATWMDFDALCQIYELSVIAWALEHARMWEAGTAEARLRLKTWAGLPGRPWTLA